MGYKTKPFFTVLAAVAIMILVGLACSLPGSSEDEPGGDEFAAVEAAEGAQENTGIHAYAANVTAYECDPGYHTGDEIVEKHLISSNAAVIESPDGNMREYRITGDEFCRTNSQGKVECVVYKSSGYQLVIYDSSEERDAEAICFESFYAIVGERNSLVTSPISPVKPEPLEAEDTATEELGSLDTIPIETYVQDAVAFLLEEDQLTEATADILTEQSIKCLSTVFPEGNIPVDAEGDPLFDENQEAAYNDFCGYMETSFFLPHLIGDWVVEDIEVIKYVDSVGDEILEPVFDFTYDPFLKVLAAYGVFLVEEDDSPSSLEGIQWRWYQTEDFPAGWEGMVIYAHALMLNLDEGAIVNLYYWIEFPEAQAQLPGSIQLAAGPSGGNQGSQWAVVLFLPMAVLLLKVRPGRKGILVGMLLVALVAIPLLTSCDAVQGFRGIIETNYNFPLEEGVHLGGGKLVLLDGEGEIAMNFYPPEEDNPTTEVFTVKGIGLLQDEDLFTIEDHDSLIE